MKYNFLILAAAALLFASCAKEVNESGDDIEQRYLKAYVRMHYGADLQPTASGLYFIPQEPLHAGIAPAGNNFLYMRSTSRAMDETIATTTVDSLAEMLGQHSKRNYYGPLLYTMEAGTAIRGLQEAFSYMKPGDKARVLLPSWLSNATASGVRAYTTTVIYDLELLRVIPDMPLFQTDSLKRYCVEHFNGEDTLKYDWYFLSTKAGDGQAPAAGDTMKVRYAGYFLDGFLFDTNIKEVAELNYGDDVDAAATYAELKVVIDDDVSKMNVVKGFAYALQRMSDGEEATTFFSSDYGYGAVTNNKIQPYSMLRFDMKVTIGRKTAAAE